MLGEMAPIIGGNWYTKLNEPSTSLHTKNKIPVTTPIMILAPIDTERKGPKIKDKATNNMTAKVIGCIIFRQKAN